MRDTSRHFLMCSPDFFIYPKEYSQINPHMKKMRNVDKKRAILEWEQLKNTLEGCGAHITLMPPVQGFPDMVFTRNGFLTLPKKTAILSSFAHLERQKERVYFFTWLNAQKYYILHFPDTAVFEGNGEAIFCKDKLFVGYGSTRAQFSSVKHLAMILYAEKLGNIDVIPLKLATKDFYHLDTCFMIIERPLGYSDILVYYPPAFDYDSQEKIKRMRHIIHIPVSEYDAYLFGCNLIAFDRHIIMPSGTKDLANTLRSYKLDVHEVCVNEFIKCGGGGPFCLTLEIG